MRTGVHRCVHSGDDCAERFSWTQGTYTHRYMEIRAVSAHDDLDATNHEDNVPGSRNSIGRETVACQVKLKLYGTRKINRAQTPTFVY